MLDASAAVELLLGCERGFAVRAALSAKAGAPEDLHAPHLVDAEVLQAFRRLLASRVVDGARAGGAIALLERFPVRRHPLRPLLPRMWALRDSLSAYDASYVSLAEVLECPLLTCDRALAKAPGHRAEVRLVA